MNNAIEQAANRPCPECGGQRVITKITAHSIYISTGIMSGTMTISVSCANCGYTTFYTEEPHKVRNHYLASL